LIGRKPYIERVIADMAINKLETKRYFLISLAEKKAANAKMIYVQNSAEIDQLTMFHEKASPVKTCAKNRWLISEERSFITNEEYVPAKPIKYGIDFTISKIKKIINVTK
jgi:hypothetical protein